MPREEIRTIFWDIGGVLLTNGWDHNQRGRVFDVLGMSAQDKAEYEARHDDANYYWERGFWTDEQFFAKTLFFKSRSFTLDDLWVEIRKEQKLLHKGSFDILKGIALTCNYRLATLNNESRELNNYRLNEFELRNWFDFLVCSAYVGEMKPAPRIYHEAIEISGCPADQTVFIDDKAENAEVASRQGMNGIHFTSPEQLEKDLHALGVNW